MAIQAVTRPSAPEADVMPIHRMLAVMCDTFKPLRLTGLCRELDDGRYALSWAEDANPVWEEETTPGVRRPLGAGHPG